MIIYDSKLYSDRDPAKENPEDEIKKKDPLLNLSRTSGVSFKTNLKTRTPRVGLPKVKKGRARQISEGTTPTQQSNTGAVLVHELSNLVRYYKEHGDLEVLKENRYIRSKASIFAVASHLCKLGYPLLGPDGTLHGSIGTISYFMDGNLPPSEQGKILGEAYFGEENPIVTHEAVPQPNILSSEPPQIKHTLRKLGAISCRMLLTKDQDLFEKYLKEISYPEPYPDINDIKDIFVNEGKLELIYDNQSETVGDSDDLCDESGYGVQQPRHQKRRASSSKPRGLEEFWDSVESFRIPLSRGSTFPGETLGNSGSTSS